MLDERQGAPVATAGPPARRARPGHATAALHRSAASPGATLTADDFAIGRADDAAKRLDAYVDSMRRNGQLQEFNRAYKLRRAAATARGEGFMAFHVAMARFKAALIPHLIGQSRVPLPSIFEVIESQ
jgi:hypothetical protein